MAKCSKDLLQTTYPVYCEMVSRILGVISCFNASLCSFRIYFTPSASIHFIISGSISLFSFIVNFVYLFFIFCWLKYFEYYFYVFLLLRFFLVVVILYIFLFDMSSSFPFLLVYVLLSYCYTSFIFVSCFELR